MKCSDDLAMIVCGAHIAGCMEQAGTIYTDTDEELMAFLVKIHEEYCKDYELDCGFAEYAESRLLDEFEIKE